MLPLGAEAHRKILAAARLLIRTLGKFAQVTRGGGGAQIKRRLAECVASSSNSSHCILVRVAPQMSRTIVVPVLIRPTSKALVVCI